MPDAPKLISIIVPCLNEEQNVGRCYEAVAAVFKGLPGYDFELIYVDDGSTDGTEKAIRKLIDADRRCCLIVNARNFGVYRSSFHALKFANGHAVMPMLPVDLQDPPELIPEFVRLWEEGNLIVAGVRYERDEPWLMRGIRRTYYRVASRLADFDLPKYVGEYQLLDRSIATQLTQIDDYYPYTRGLIASLSNKRATIPYVWQKREVGKSNMNLWKLIDQGLNGIVSTSTAPLRLVSILGLAIALFAFAFGIVQLIAHFTFASSITDPGISTIILLVSFFAAVNAVCFGVVAEYLGAVHAQVRGRWRVVERERVNLGDPQ
jgi:glycosyltransferase involved in cell wall biosynthesis